jgi:D-alanyl-D-alanine carboxypeptidase/D-alanyl-D-alanine-endopeptidase (penicillin-binding protein 4)
MPSRRGPASATMAGMSRTAVLGACVAAVLTLSGVGVGLAAASGPGQVGGVGDRAPMVAGAPIVSVAPGGATVPSSGAAEASPAPAPAGPGPALAAQLHADLAGNRGCAEVVSGGQVLAATGAGTTVAPASTQKLLVAAAALDTLGANYRFVTRVEAAGPVVGGVAPRLWLVGSGDPMLASQAWMGLVLTHSHYPSPPVTPLSWLVPALRAAGITTVPGGISGDSSLYPAQLWIPTWKPVYVSEGDAGPLSALDLDEGWKAFGPGWLPAADPAAHAADQLSAYLRAAGIPVGSVAPDSPAPPGARTLATLSSAPLSAIVSYMLGTSDNHAAELLTRAVGLAHYGLGTTAAGTRAVLAVDASLGVPTGQAVMVDGSGLSPENRATCSELLGALELGGRPGLTALQAGLPVAGRTGTLYRTWAGTPWAGRLAAKTGWIDGAAAVVGMLPGSRPVQFAFAVNGRFPYSQALAMESQALGSLDRYSQVSGAPTTMAP